MSDINTESIISLANLVMIDVKKAVFKPENGGYLSVNYNGTEYKKIKLSRALPYHAPEDYICISDKDGKEIGILKSVRELEDEQRTLVSDELKRIYYTPTINKIISAKFRMGFLYLNVITTAGKREFAVKDPSKSIRFIDPVKRASIQILDADGNRYLIEDYLALDTASSKKIDSYLV